MNKMALQGASFTGSITHLQIETSIPPQSTVELPGGFCGKADAPKLASALVKYIFTTISRDLLLNYFADLGPGTG